MAVPGSLPPEAPHAAHQAAPASLPPPPLLDDCVEEGADPLASALSGGCGDKSEDPCEFTLGAGGGAVVIAAAAGLQERSNEDTADGQQKQEEHTEASDHLEFTLGTGCVMPDPVAVALAAGDSPKSQSFTFGMTRAMPKVEVKPEDQKAAEAAPPTPCSDPPGVARSSLGAARARARSQGNGDQRQLLGPKVIKSLPVAPAAAPAPEAQEKEGQAAEEAAETESVHSLEFTFGTTDAPKLPACNPSTSSSVSPAVSARGSRRSQQTKTALSVIQDGASREEGDGGAEQLRSSAMPLVQFPARSPRPASAPGAAGAGLAPSPSPLPLPPQAHPGLVGGGAEGAWAIPAQEAEYAHALVARPATAPAAPQALIPAPQHAYLATAPLATDPYGQVQDVYVQDPYSQVQEQQCAAATWLPPPPPPATAPGPSAVDLGGGYHASYGPYFGQQGWQESVQVPTVQKSHGKLRQQCHALKRALGCGCVVAIFVGLAVCLVTFSSDLRS